MSKKIALIVAAVMAAALFLAVPARPGTVPASIVPEGASWIAHIDMERLVAGRLFQALDKDGRFEIKSRDVDRWLKIDVRKDIAGVTIFGLGPDEKQAVIAVTGRFDKAELLARIASDEDHKEVPYGAYTLHSMNGDGYGTFVNDGLIVLSESRTAIEKVLDTAAGKAKSFAASDLNAAFKGLAPGAFVSGVVKDLTGLGRGIHQSKLVGKAGGLSFTAMEKGDILQVRVRVTAESPESAKNMADLVQGLVALGRMGEAGGREGELMALLDGLRVGLDGQTVNIEFEGPVQEIAGMIAEKRVPGGFLD